MFSHHRALSKQLNNKKVNIRAKSLFSSWRMRSAVVSAFFRSVSVESEPIKLQRQH